MKNKVNNRSTKDEALKSKLRKGTRVICRIDKNEWYTGTIADVGESVNIDFDDGSKSAAPNDELKFIKRLLVDRQSKVALTFDQAEPLWKKTMTRVIYDARMEKEFAVNLRDCAKPWIEVQQSLRNVCKLMPFNELLTLDFRSPIHEYSLGMFSSHTNKLTPTIVESLLETTADAVEKFAKACGLIVQRNGDNSRLAVSNSHQRQQLRIRLGAFKGGRSYVQVTPI